MLRIDFSPLFAIIHPRGDFVEIRAKCKFGFESISALTHLTMFKNKNGEVAYFYFR